MQGGCAQVLGPSTCVPSRILMYLEGYKCTLLAKCNKDYNILPMNMETYLEGSKCTKQYPTYLDLGEHIISKTV